MPTVYASRPGLQNDDMMLFYLDLEERMSKTRPSQQIEELRAKTKGDTVVIVSSEGPHLTLTVGRPKRSVAPDWHSHFEWLRKQPVII